MSCIWSINLDHNFTSAIAGAGLNADVLQYGSRLPMLQSGVTKRHGGYIKKSIFEFCSGAPLKQQALVGKLAYADDRSELSARSKS